MHKRYYPFQASLVLLCVLLTSLTAFADSVPKMSVDELNSRLGTAETVILDVRSGRDWNAANTRITGSERVNPGEVGQWAENFPKGKTIVLYCA